MLDLRPPISRSLSLFPAYVDNTHPIAIAANPTEIKSTDAPTLAKLVSPFDRNVVKFPPTINAAMIIR